MELKSLSDGAVIRLPDYLLWVDEHAWTPGVASVSYLLTGALLVESAIRQAGGRSRSWGARIWGG